MLDVPATYSGITAVTFCAVNCSSCDPRTTLRTRYAPGFTVNTILIVNPVALNRSTVESFNFNAISRICPSTNCPLLSNTPVAKTTSS